MDIERMMHLCEEQIEYIPTQDEIRMSGVMQKMGGTGHYNPRIRKISLSQLPIHQSAQATQGSVEISQGQLDSPPSKIQGVHNLV